MATPKIVMGQVVGPDGSGKGESKVRITLSAPAFVNGTQEVLTSPLIVQTDQEGVWTTKLWSNLDLVPATTHYSVTEIAGDGSAQTTYTITVPQTAGPFFAATITP